MGYRGSTRLFFYESLSSNGVHVPPYQKAQHSTHTNQERIPPSPPSSPLSSSSSSSSGIRSPRENDENDTQRDNKRELKEEPRNTSKDQHITFFSLSKSKPTQAKKRAVSPRLSAIDQRLLLFFILFSRIRGRTEHPPARMCYVGKATKIFIFIVTALVVLGLVIGFGPLRHSLHHRSHAHQCSGDSSSCIFSSPLVSPTTPTAPIYPSTPDTGSSSTQPVPSSSNPPPSPTASATTSSYPPPPSPVLSPPITNPTAPPPTSPSLPLSPPPTPPAELPPPPPPAPPPATTAAPPSYTSPPSPGVVTPGPVHA